MPDFVPDTPPDVAPPVAVTVRIRASDGVADPCRIIPVGKSLDLKAVPTPDVPGTYQWTTSSTKVSLTNSNSQTVTVQAGAAVSSGLNAETITVTFTPSSGSAASATLTLTVISVVFSAAAGQNWGYDDMDSAAGVDHHVSVRKNSSTTVRVTISGGAVAADLIFTSDDATIADTSPPGGGAAFDLTINGKNQNKSETTLKALCNCPSGHECATLKANVYREKAVTATVAKVYDSTVASTTLTRPNMDMAPAQTRIREWYKPPVATITLTDHSATGGSVDIRYDLNSSGRLELEPGAVSNEQAAITAAFNPTGQKVVIVKDLA